MCDINSFPNAESFTSHLFFNMAPIPVIYMQTLRLSQFHEWAAVVHLAHLALFATAGVFETKKIW